MRVGFIGLGQMGLGMARNLVAAGHTTTVYDLRQEAMDAVPGAQHARTPAEAAVGADVTCVAVFDEAQVRSVVLGAEGVLATAAAESVVMLHSTIRPGLAVELDSEASQRGVWLLDAAMSGGGETAADAGTLTFMVGGDKTGFRKAEDVLLAMSSRIFHVGDVGAGASAKIVSNFLLDGNVTLVREALRLGLSAGISEAHMLELVRANAVGSSWVSSNWGEMRSLEQNHWSGPQVIVSMWRKDLGLANQMAQQNDVAAPVLNFIASKVVPTISDAGLTVLDD